MKHLSVLIYITMASLPTALSCKAVNVTHGSNQEVISFDFGDLDQKFSPNTSQYIIEVFPFYCDDFLDTNTISTEMYVWCNDDLTLRSGDYQTMVHNDLKDQQVTGLTDIVYSTLGMDSKLVLLNLTLRSSSHFINAYTLSGVASHRINLLMRMIFKIKNS